jgi:hypothetical protein
MKPSRNAPTGGRMAKKTAAKTGAKKKTAKKKR